MAELLKAVKILDAPRAIRQKQKRMAKVVNRRKLGKLRSEITDLQQEQVPSGSLSGSMIKYIKTLIVVRIPAEKLQFFALQLPTEPWRELADLLHLHPTNDLPLPWFLPHAFGTAVPADSVLAECGELTAANAAEKIAKFRLPYSYVRGQLRPLPDDAKLAVARQSPLDQILWWMEELSTPEVDALIAERMDAGETVTLNFGKLMERLFLFKSANYGSAFFDRLLPVAEDRLRAISLQLESPVVVIGDASYVKRKNID